MNAALDSNIFTFILQSASTTSTMLAVIGGLGMVLVAFALISKLVNGFYPSQWKQNYLIFCPLKV